MYFVRINSNNINPLIKESLNVNKKTHDEGKYSWYICVNNIFKEFDLDYSNIDKPFHRLKFLLKKEFKKKALNNYTLKTKDKLSKLTESSKLFLYSKLKNDIILEPYLLQLSNFKNRQIITKFWSSDHNLKMEKGRCKNTPRQQRLRNTCNNIEHEDHFFLHCRIHNQPKNYRKFLTLLICLI